MDAVIAHDRAVDQLSAALEAFFRPVAGRTVLTRASWQPLREFPNYVYTFDVLVVAGGLPWSGGAGSKTFGPDLSVVTALDVVTPGDYEAEYYDKPDALTQTAVYEYCLLDPTGEVMRPSFQAFRKRDGAFQRLRSSRAGVFFSSGGFRLEVNGPTIEVSPCGRPWLEEDLFECRAAYARVMARPVRDEREPNRLEAKIRRLEERRAVVPSGDRP